MICQISTDTCYQGTCQCGVNFDLTCQKDSQYPFCVDGGCKCSKNEDKYEKGDGTTRGTCNSPFEKCQASGLCLECSHSSQCSVITKGLADTCLRNICVCGAEENSQVCNGTISNRCSNGVCLCGSNPQCSRTDHVEELGHCTKEKCGTTAVNGICGCFYEDNKCKIPRSGNEICEKITEYYNPLHIDGALHYGNESVILCDDIIG